MQETRGQITREAHESLASILLAINHLSGTDPRTLEVKRTARDFIRDINLEWGNRGSGGIHRTAEEFIAGRSRMGEIITPEVISRATERITSDLQVIADNHPLAAVRQEANRLISQANPEMSAEPFLTFYPNTVAFVGTNIATATSHAMLIENLQMIGDGHPKRRIREDANDLLTELKNPGLTPIRLEEILQTAQKLISENISKIESNQLTESSQRSESNRPRLFDLIPKRPSSTQEVTHQTYTATISLLQEIAAHNPQKEAECTRLINELDSAIRNGQHKKFLQIYQDAQTFIEANVTPELQRSIVTSLGANLQFIDRFASSDNTLKYSIFLDSCKDDKHTFLKDYAAILEYVSTDLPLAKVAAAKVLDRALQTIISAPASTYSEETVRKANELRRALSEQDFSSNPREFDAVVDRISFFLSAKSIHVAMARSNVYYEEDTSS